jgi:hypothetical protein
VVTFAQGVLDSTSGVAPDSKDGVDREISDGCAE